MHKILNWSQSGVGVPLDSLQSYTLLIGCVFILLFAIMRCFSYVLNYTGLIPYPFGKSERSQAVTNEVAKEALVLKECDASRLLPGSLFLPQASG